jgi:hypothetical protein
LSGHKKKGRQLIIATLFFINQSGQTQLIHSKCPDSVSPGFLPPSTLSCTPYTISPPSPASTKAETICIMLINMAATGWDEVRISTKTDDTL